MASRRRLRRFVNQRRTFRARFIGFSMDHLGNRTMLLRDIADLKSGQYLCDHAWIHYNIKRPQFGAYPRDEIQFEATVRPYRSGVGLYKTKRFKILEGFDAQ